MRVVVAKEVLSYYKVQLLMDFDMTSLVILSWKKMRCHLNTVCNLFCTICVWIKVYKIEKRGYILVDRRPVGSTSQAYQVISTSEFHEYLITYGPTLFLFSLSSRVSAGPQKPQSLTASKTKYENYGPKIQIPH